MFKNILIVMVIGLLSLQVFGREEIIRHENYTLNYNEDHEIANWVSYELDRSKLQNCVTRKNNFRPDPLVSTGTAENQDYKGSGFDRGHLIPAGDMKFSKLAMSETFFYSNMTPQPASFNRGRWQQLETLIRAWALAYEKIWIVTGPIIIDNLPTIGRVNIISIPQKYYKVILRKKGNSYSGIGFLMGTNTPKTELSAYVTTIKEIEKITNENFFAFLSDRQSQKAEDNVDLKEWDFQAKFNYLPCGTLEAL